MVETGKTICSGGTAPGKKPIVVSDWEGPWVSPDHAADIARTKLPRGGELWSALSNYALYLSDVKHVESFQPGGTLGLIAPFLITYDVGERDLNEMAIQDARFIVGALDAIDFLQRTGHSFWVVSTSYHQYVWYTAQIAGISQERTRCTYFPIESLQRDVKEHDKELVREITDQVADTAVRKLDKFKREEDLPPNVREAAETLNDLFLQRLRRSSFEHVLRTVRPVGGQRKLDSLHEILRLEDRSIKEAAVIGDSITDRNMLGETKNNKGLAIAFNGNAPAVENANVAVMSYDCTVTPLLIQIFGRAGIGEIEHVTMNWSPETLKREVSIGNLDEKLFARFLEPEVAKRARAIWVTGDNMKRVIDESVKHREEVRGGVAGKLT